MALFCTASIVSCSLGIQEIDKPSIPDLSSIETPGEGDEISIEEESNMKVLALEEYGNYVIYGKKLFGVDGRDLLPVECKTKEGGKVPFKSLIIDNGLIYFSVSEWNQSKNGEDMVETVHYFSQAGKTLTEIEASDIPVESDGGFVTMKDGVFKIEKSEYNGMDISRIYNGPLVVAYKQIDGFSMLSAGNVTGILYSVAESHGTRTAGIYIWWDNDSGPRSVKDGGRVY